MRLGEIKNIQYVSSKEAIVIVEWFDNEENKTITLKGLCEEVEE